MDRSETVTRILDTAEHMARAGGYGGFSFREIAQIIGIKPASVHYHFPTKADLGVALVERYTEGFLERLGAADSAPPSELRKRYVAAFSAALRADGKMCLCGLFGAEVEALPDPIAERTAAFFLANLAWLGQVYRSDGLPDANADQEAATLLSALEGAMILARSLNRPELFDLVAKRLA